MSWVAGRVAVVTGASRGIGRATAEALARAGASVVLAARDADALAGVASALRDEGQPAVDVPCDVSDSASVDALFAAADAVGPATILVTAAGTLEPAELEATSDALWSATIGTNLTGAFRCCRAAFPRMRDAGGGRIINIASLGGIYATEKFPGLLAYTVSKHGVVGLTEAVAAEGRDHGIAAVCISPGAVDTEMLRRAAPHLRAGLQPADVGELIVALLAEPMDAISGANIPLFSNL